MATHPAELWKVVGSTAASGWWLVMTEVVKTTRGGDVSYLQEYLYEFTFVCLWPSFRDGSKSRSNSVLLYLILASQHVTNREFAPVYRLPGRCLPVWKASITQMWLASLGLPLSVLHILSFTPDTFCCHTSSLNTPPFLIFPLEENNINTTSSYVVRVVTSWQLI